MYTMFLLVRSKPSDLCKATRRNDRISFCPSPSKCKLRLFNKPSLNPDLLNFLFDEPIQIRMPLPNPDFSRTPATRRGPRTPSEEPPSPRPESRDESPTRRVSFPLRDKFRLSRERTRTSSPRSQRPPSRRGNLPYQRRKPPVRRRLRSPNPLLDYELVSLSLAGATYRVRQGAFVTFPLNTFPPLSTENQAWLDARSGLVFTSTPVRPATPPSRQDSTGRRPEPPVEDCLEIDLKPGHLSWFDPSPPRSTSVSTSSDEISVVDLFPGWGDPENINSHDLPDGWTQLLGVSREDEDEEDTEVPSVAEQALEPPSLSSQLSATLRTDSSTPSADPEVKIVYLNV